jgi:hypothetical protein
MPEPWIRGSALAGLASIALGAYACAYRAASLCSVPDGCDVPAARSHHPYVFLGYALLVAGCAALVLAVGVRHRSAVAADSRPASR